jgi:hypothetical protein
MARVVEKHYEHDHSGDTSAATVAVVIVGLLLIIGVLLYALGALPFFRNGVNGGTGTVPNNVNIQVPNQTPAPNNGGMPPQTAP